MKLLLLAAAFLVASCSLLCDPVQFSLTALRPTGLGSQKLLVSNSKDKKLKKVWLFRYSKSMVLKFSHASKSPSGRFLLKHRWLRLTPRVPNSLKSVVGLENLVSNQFPDIHAAASLRTTC